MSNIKIYLDGTGTSETINQFKIEYFRSDYTNNPNFEKLRVSINYYHGFSYFSSASFYLYIGEIQGCGVRVTYTPDTVGRVANELEAYFSKLHPDKPLVIGFRIKSSSSFDYYRYSELRDKSITYPPNNGIGEDGLDNLLTLANREINKKFTFKKGGNSNVNIKQISSYDENITFVGSSKDFKKIILLSDLYPCRGEMNLNKILYNEKLMRLATNTINPMFLTSVIDKNFENAVIYCSHPKNEPLLVEFVEDFDVRYHFVKKDLYSTYWEKKDPPIQYGEDYSNLIRELSRIESETNERMTFLVEKTRSYSSNIEVSKITSNLAPGFYKYTHVPQEKKISILLFNGDFLKDEQQHKINKVDGQIFQNVTAYFSDESNQPLLLQLEPQTRTLKQSYSYYMLKRNTKGFYWSEFNSESYNNIIDINFGFPNGIHEQLTENNNSKLKQLLTKIKLFLIPSVFILMGHISSYDDHQVLQAIKYKEMNRIEINTLKVQRINKQLNCLTGQQYCVYEHDLTNVIRTYKKVLLKLIVPNDHEITTYSDSRGQNKEDIYSVSGQNKVYVYFYGQYYRPLLVFYYNRAYRPQSIDNYNKVWIPAQGLITYHCITSDKKLIERLFEVSDDLNPVKINEKKNGTYVIHFYDSGNLSINLSKEPLGCYIKYTHTPTRGHRLGNIMYGSTYVRDNSKKISARGNDEVVVFYYNQDTNNRHPLLIALKTTGGEYRPHYKLSDKDKKNYTKSSISIKLNGNNLSTILDEINYAILNSLFITMCNKKPYQAKIVPNSGIYRPSATEMINVEIKLDWKSAISSNYSCYQHKLTVLNQIHDIGGLKLYLSDDNQINLYNGSISVSKIHYNYCKGDLYVYFYGKDPRPLLICYNKNIYKPESKSQYANKWVKDDTIASSNGTSTTILDKIICDLNPVDLNYAVSITDQITDSKYNSVTFNEVKIEITFTPSTFRCYNKYTHKSQEGFRLGNVVYTWKSQFYRIDYNKHKELIVVVVYYYKHDNDRAHPLIVELEFKQSHTNSQTEGSNCTFKEYYELSRANGSYEWTKCDCLSELENNRIGEKDPDGINEKLLEKLYDLNLKYNSGNKKNPEDEDCIDKFPTLEASLGISLPTVSIGSGFLIYKYGGKVLALLTSLF